MPIIGGSPSLHYKRLMVFVDGTNLLIELSKELSIDFRADKPPLAAIALARAMIDAQRPDASHVQVRRYWFSSYQGDEQLHRKLAIALRKNDFEPVLFKRRGGREKGVDIALTKEMLVNAFNQNFDVGLLVAGDEDYVGLVTEVKRYGPIVAGMFFEHGLSEDLYLAFDWFRPLGAGVNEERKQNLLREISKA